MGKKVIGFSVLLIFSLFGTIQGYSFEYHSESGFSASGYVNINTHDYDGEKMTISSISYQENSIRVLDIKNNTQNSLLFGIPAVNVEEIVKVKIMHVNDTSILVFYSIYTNESKLQLYSFRYLNGNYQTIQNFELSTNDSNNNEFNVFKFQNNIYLYLLEESNLKLYEFDQSFVKLDLKYSYPINNLFFVDFGISFDKILFSFHNQFHTDGTVVILEKDFDNFTEYATIEIIGNKLSIAPLNQSFLIINDTSLIEISLTFNQITNLIDKLPNTIQNYNNEKIRAFSNQELIIQTSQSITGYLRVNDVISKVWEIETYQFSNTFFDISYSTNEVIFFFKDQNNPQSQQLGYLVIHKGLSDPTETISSLGINFWKSTWTSTWTDSGTNYPDSDLPIIVIISIIPVLLLVSAIYFITRKGKNLNNQKINTKGITNKILCPNCRNKLEEGSVYCSTCGQEILKK